ncbi:unnamed protein product [Dicrocoelium dendriticum]|nr:unnamed protein product [Dicrocoelium dendriticum]
MDKRDNGIENTTTDVGVQHRLDAPVHSSSVRRPSSSHSISEDDLDQNAPFVRKRAYVSAHQAVEPEQPGVFSTLYSPRLCSSPFPPVSGQCTSSSSCQLLLAAPQRTLSTNSHTVNPKITHLPHRRSSRSIPANSVKSRTSNQMKQSALPGVHYTASANPVSIDCSPVVENAATHPPVATSEVSSLLTHRSGNDASFESGKLPDPALPDGHIFPRRAKSHNKCVRPKRQQ